MLTKLSLLGQAPLSIIYPMLVLLFGSLGFCKFIIGGESCISYNSHTILNKEIYPKNKWIANLKFLPVDAMLKVHMVNPRRYSKAEKDLFYIHYASIRWKDEVLIKKNFDSNKHIMINEFS